MLGSFHKTGLFKIIKSLATIFFLNIFSCINATISVIPVGVTMASGGDLSRVYVTIFFGTVPV